jgi:hypothetical protein
MSCFSSVGRFSHVPHWPVLRVPRGWNRTDCCADRLNDYWVFVSNSPFTPADTPATLASRPGTWNSHQITAPNPSARITTDGASARYVRVQLSGANSLSLAEVQIFPK